MGDPHIILDQRCQQLAALGNQGYSVEAESDLRGALGDEAWRVRSTAARTLGRIGARSALQEPTLHALLELAGGDGIAWSRHAATWTLCHQAGRDDRTARTIAAAVVERLGDVERPGGDQTLHLLELARRLPPGVIDPTAIIAALDDDDWHVRASAAMTVGLHGGAGGAAGAVVQALVRGLRDEDPGVREAAAEGLAAIGGQAAQDALLTLADDPEPAVQAAGIRALGALRDGDLEAIRSAVDGALTSPHSRVRQAAAMLASHLGAAAAPLLPELIDALGDQDTTVADSVGYALVDIAAEEQALAPMLWRAVENREGRVRVRALDLVRQVSGEFPNAHSSIETVTRFLLNEMRGSTYRAATWLLRQVPLSHADAMSVVLESLGKRSTSARWRALALLQRSPETVQTMIPALRRVLHDSSARVRRLAVEMTPPLGAAARPALPELARRAFEGDHNVNQEARRALKALLHSDRRGRAPRPALFPPLIQDWLSQIGPKTELSDVVAAPLRSSELDETLIDDFVRASRAHAAWHNAVGERRAKKHDVRFTPLPAPGPDSSPLDVIAHAVAAARARAQIHVADNERDEVVDRIVHREYGWHLGRLLDLMNRHLDAR